MKSNKTMCKRKVFSENYQMLITNTFLRKKLSTLIIFIATIIATVRTNVENLNVPINGIGISFSCGNNSTSINTNSISRRRRIVSVIRAYNTNNHINFSTVNKTLKYTINYVGSTFRQVTFIKIFCFLMLFIGVTALPPVIRIGKYILSSILM